MLLIDDRAGSAPRTVTRTVGQGYRLTRHYEGLIDFSPLNTCADCQALFVYKQVKGKEVRICATGNERHQPFAQLHRLSSGDVSFVGNGPESQILIGVEVKSILDLISSLDTGRLQADQIPGMINDYTIRWLCYYGEYRPNPSTGTLQTRKVKDGKERWVDYAIGKRPVPYGYVEAFLCSPSFTNTGMQSKRVMDLAEAAAWIGVLYRTWQKDYSKHKSMRVLSTAQDLPTMMPGIDEQTLLKAKIASQLPGVGHARAMAAARHFRSVREMVNADSKEWMKIDGFGKVIGAAVERAVQ